MSRADMERRRAPLPDWLVAATVFVAWLALRQLTFADPAHSGIVNVLTVVITGVVVAQFYPGDPPRRGWMLALVTFALVALGITLRDQAFAAAGSQWWMHVYFGVNVAWAATIVVFARNILGLGLRPRWTPASIAAVGTSILLAVATGGYLLREATIAWSEVGWGFDPASFGPFLLNASSAIADPTVFVGAVLIARAMLPMVGGAVARPYLLLSAAAAAYLTLDVISIVRPETWVQTGRIVFSFGEAFFVAAAISQLQLAWRDR